MKESFWNKLRKPFLILAPMEDVTDIVFRHMMLRIGRPDVFFTEFTSSDALFSPGERYAKQRLLFKKDEHPIVAQIWGNNPENYHKAAKVLVEMGFDGIDINMGCPDKSIVAHGCCGGLINNPSLAKEIIHATKEAAGDVPVSVKTRIGFNKIQTESWVSHLLEQDIAVLTIHGRTVAERSKVPAHWDEIGKAVEIRNQMKIETLIVGNGDVEGREEAMEKHEVFGVDGVMIGRGVFHNPWVFNTHRTAAEVPTEEKLQLLIDHIELFRQTWGDEKPFDIMRKFYKIYINEIPNAHNFRMELMELNTPEETIEHIRKYMENRGSKF